MPFPRKRDPSRVSKRPLVIRIAGSIAIRYFAVKGLGIPYVCRSRIFIEKTRVRIFLGIFLETGEVVNGKTVPYIFLHSKVLGLIFYWI